MFKEKLKALMVKEGEKDSKKKIENIVVLILILIITIIAINAIWNGDKKQTTRQEQTTVPTKQLAVETGDNEESNEDDIQTKLENILCNIDGVGKVKVLISYSESSEVIAMYNENSKNSQIEEKDSGGGTRVTTQEDTQKDIIYKEENGEKIPITQKVVSPKIEGAIVTAQGAGSANVKNNIILAVEAVTGLSSHKIQVFEMRKD
ncbi:MAG: hypothetical protein J6A04_04295 [Clostridia bacterium]|nr:hypothetical protein [Clostridia bacterium]